MSLAEEKILLTRFARVAGAGEMLNIHDLKAAYEKAIGHATSDGTIWLAQADATSVSSQARPRGAECF